MVKPNTALNQLAIFGGRPTFDESLHVNQPNVGGRAEFLARVEGMLERRWFTNHGPLVAELEQKLADYLGVAHCVLTCNGTVALQLALRALGLTGEIIVPSFTFVATAHSILWQGLTPVFCDIDPSTWNLDAAQCEQLITERTTAILAVHLWGRPCEPMRLAEIAQRHGLRLVFDSAHAFGCSHRGVLLAGLGDAEVFSFHATKAFHTFEGGAVTTNSREIAAKIALLRNFGFVGYDQVARLGTNAKMPEVCAAMGLSNLEHLDRLLEANKDSYETYRRGLEEVPGLRLLRYDEQERHNYQYVVLEVSEGDLGLSRDQLLSILHAENIYARRYFYPGCHRLEPYASRWPQTDARLPETNLAARRVLVLPAGSELPRETIHSVCSILRMLSQQADVVRHALKARDC